MKVHYQEGDWFALPLPSGGYAVGVVARTSKQGKVLCGYFFGPRRQVVPQAAELEALDPNSATLVARFGDLALIRNEWSILGQSPGWDRGRWPMPAFVSRDPLNGKVWMNEYADPNSLLDRTPIADASARSMPADGVHGSGALAKLLDRLLTEQGDSGVRQSDPFTGR